MEITAGCGGRKTEKTKTEEEKSQKPGLKRNQDTPTQIPVLSFKCSLLPGKPSGEFIFKKLNSLKTDN